MSSLPSQEDSSFSCEEVQRVAFELDEPLPGEMTDEQRQLVVAHLATCESCRSLRERERQLTGMLMNDQSTVLPASTIHNRKPLMAVLGVVAATILLFAGYWMGRQSQSSDRVETISNVGSINTRPVITNANWFGTTRELGLENHIDLPAGANAEIELFDTGKVSATGPAIFELDRIDETWKITLLKGQVNVTVLDGKSIKVSSAAGVSELTGGTYVVSESETPVAVEETVNNAQDDTDEKTAQELLQEAQVAFSDGDMKKAAELYGRAARHKEIARQSKEYARFYHVVSLYNSNQFESCLDEASQFLKEHANYDGVEMVKYLYGDTLWQLGRNEEAREYLKGFLKEHPDSYFRPHIIGKFGEEMVGESTAEESVAEKKAEIEAIVKPDIELSDDKLTVLWTKELQAPSFGSAAVADVDGDDLLEIAFGTYFGDDSVRVLNGEDGSQLWQHDAGTACLDASLRFFDLDSDGDIELLVPVSNKGQMIAFDPKTGEEIWTYQPSPTECTDSPSTILDIDGDGDIEFVYGTFLGNLHVVNASTGKDERIYKVSDEFIQTAATVADLNDDGAMDFVCATFKGENKVYAIDGKSGERLWEYKVPGDHMGMYHGCSVGDLDGDGRIELVIGAYDGKIHCIDAADGSKKWDVSPGDRYFMSPTVIADLDGDEKLEVIAASERVSVIDHQGNVMWSNPCAVENSWDCATRGASIADLNGDGQLDVVTLSGAGVFRVWSGDDGRQLYGVDAEDICDFNPYSSSHGVTIADLDGDKKLDVFFVVGSSQQESRKGLAICLSGFEGTGRGWYMLRHDPQSTGNLHTEIDKTLIKFIER